MKAIILLSLLFLCSCANMPTNDVGKLELAASVGTLEAVNDDKGNRVVLEEVSAALDAFCGQGPIDKLALIRVLREKLGPKTGTRVGFLLLLVDESQINPSDMVAWGNAACSLRNGIKTGLAIAK